MAPATETVMFRYFAFKGAPNSNCNLKVIYITFKGAPNSH